MDMNTQMRLTGLASGLDTDAIIQQLSRIQTARIDTVKRDRQYLMWQQESFRGTINMINDFVRNNLNIANPASNFRSPTAFAKFNYNVAVNGLKTETAKNAASNILSVTANGDLRNFNQTVEQVKQLASRDTWSGGETGMRDIKTKDFDLWKFYSVNESGQLTSASTATFALSIDGTTRTISVDPLIMRDMFFNTMYKESDVSGKTWTVEDVQSHAVPDGNGNMITVLEHFDNIWTGGNGTTTAQDVADFLNNDEPTYFADNNITVSTLSDRVDRNTAFAEELNRSISRAFGSDYNNVVKVDASGELIFSKQGSQITLGDMSGATTTLRNFGLEGGASSGIEGKNIGDLFGLDYFALKDAMGNIIYTTETYKDENGIEREREVPRTRERTIIINGAQINLLHTDSLHVMMSKINNSEAGVTMSYNSAADKFELSSKTEGSAANIGEVTGATAEFFEILKLGTTVDVARVLTSEDGQQMTLMGKKFVIGGELMADLQQGEWLVLSDVSGGDPENGFGTNTTKQMSIDARGNIVVTTFTHEGHGLATLIQDGTADDGKFLWNGTVYDTMDDVLAAAGSDMTAQDTNGDGNRFVIGKRTEELVTYEKQTDGSFTDGTTTFANMNDAIVQLGGDLGEAVGSRNIGTNLIATINGAEFVRQSNSFTHEGMTYTFHGTYNVDGTEPPIKMDVSTDTAALVESIKGFVEEYNQILEHINNLLNEKRDREYMPLTEDEKKAMTEAEIKAYEDRAKLGMMANDTDLRKLQNDLRAAIYTKVEGVGLSMADIGITTTANYKDGGKLVIDETKLSEAIAGNYENVVALFTKQSDIPASDIANRGQRRMETGIAQRINDIMNDAVRTTRDANNRKGTLIEKAGIQNDSSALQNSIQTRLNNYDARINALLQRWYRQENTLYAMFARMENAMMKMQSQQNSLAGLMAQGG